MSRLAGVRLSDVCGCGRMAVDAAHGLTGVVEGVHTAVARWADPLGLTHGVTRMAYGTVRAAVGLVGHVVGAAGRAVRSSGPDEHSSPGRETALAIVNGVLGDYLADTGNPLAIPMQFRRHGRPLPLETPLLAERLPTSPKILLSVHGLCLNDLHWARHEDDPCEELAARLGCAPVHLHYNTGLHVSTNGRRLSELLETLVERWPVPVEELVVVAHSMGGLVARSACHYGALDGCTWPRHLRKLVFLGTPHHGSVLERAGNWVDFLLEKNACTSPLARVGQIRSAGITDLRFGSVHESDWQGRGRFHRTGDCRQPVPLPEGVRCYTVAAVVDRGLRGRLLGDGLVPLDSALGHHENPALALTFPESHRWVSHGMRHIELLRRPEVYERLEDWLAA